MMMKKVKQRDKCFRERQKLDFLGNIGLVRKTDNLLGNTKLKNIDDWSRNVEMLL